MRLRVLPITRAAKTFSLGTFSLVISAIAMALTGNSMMVSPAAAVTAWADAPPASGYCWYYTDPSRTRGFWDVCQ
jgi:hypothetical protein